LHYLIIVTNFTEQNASWEAVSWSICQESIHLLQNPRVQFSDPQASITGSYAKPDGSTPPHHILFL
jgi:hypothetical protein